MIEELLKRIDRERLQRDLFHLSKAPLPYRKVNYTLPGHSKSSLDETDDVLEAQLQAAGYAVRKTPYQVRPFRCDSTKPLHHWYAPPRPEDPWYTASNLEAERPGSTCADEVIVLVAHKDSMSWIDSPGALDNGVGTVVNLEIARALAAYSPRHTLRFLFCNEEHTPWTSAFAAQAAARRGDRLIAVLNQDALTGKSEADRERGALTHVVAYSTPEGGALAKRVLQVNEKYRIGLEATAVFKEHVNDDDGMFIKAGFPHTVMNVGSFPYQDAEYHLVGDVPERVDFDQLQRSAQLVLATVLELDREGQS